MKHAIVIGSGAGGATVAKELQSKFDVTVLEAGKNSIRSARAGDHRAAEKDWLASGRKSHVALFPMLHIRKTPDMVLVNGIGLGGTTTISTVTQPGWIRI